MRSKAHEDYLRLNSPTSTPAPIVYSWKAKLEKDEKDFRERIVQGHKDMGDKMKYYHSRWLQELARRNDDQKKKWNRRECRVPANGGGSGV